MKKITIIFIFKSLILKLHPNNFIQNIPFYFSLIENLKKLRIN